MPRIPYRYPAAGIDPIADRIRERRGARGLTPLDGTLLNAPLVADGWNSFIGTLRTKNSLPDDVRELMILRVAACNGAAFEWIHHEHVARAAGITQEQLAVIGSVASSSSGLSDAPLDLPAGHSLSPLQAAALAFADSSTRQVKVPNTVFEAFKKELQTAISSSGKETTVEQQLLEATATVGGYNLVSRLLVALDVDDRCEMTVPVPQVKRVDVPGCSLHAVRVENFDSPDAPTLLFINSLMSNYSMWSEVMSAFAKTHHLIFYDQRGHGQSAVPAAKTNLRELADDAAAVLDAFGVQRARAVIGVSQGGATALSFAIRHPRRTDKIVACDTQAKGPEANIKAWDDRIALARAEGMEALADATVPRWFTEQTSFQQDSKVGQAIRRGVINTDVEGFAKAAAALQGYDLLAEGLLDSLRTNFADGKNVLLVAGECDGKLPEGLQKLGADVGSATQVIVVSKGGHLPMVNEPAVFSKAVLAFLEQ